MLVHLVFLLAFYLSHTHILLSFGMAHQLHGSPVADTITHYHSEK